MKSEKEVQASKNETKRGKIMKGMGGKLEREKSRVSMIKRKKLARARININDARVTSVRAYYHRTTLFCATLIELFSKTW